MQFRKYSAKSPSIGVACNNTIAGKVSRIMLGDVNLVPNQICLRTSVEL